MVYFNLREFVVDCLKKLKVVALAKVTIIEKNILGEQHRWMDVWNSDRDAFYWRIL